jgi:hypothetical protein
MRTINFSYNWNNKLDNKVFTTIRANFIPVQPGTTLQIHLKGKLYCWAKVQECIKCKFSDINTLILWLDTGYAPEEAFKVFKSMGLDYNRKDQDCMLLIFERAIKPLDDQIRDVLTMKFPS